MNTLPINYQSNKNIKLYHQLNFNKCFLFHHVFYQLSINYLLYILLSNKYQTIIEADEKFQYLSIILKLKLLFENFQRSIILSIPTHNYRNLTLIYAGFFWGVYSRGGVLSTPPEKIGHISQTVKASLTKFSDISCLPIPLDLSLFGAKSHA